jgi:ACS family hexuronate transporter-like MFS transporter
MSDERATAKAPAIALAAPLAPSGFKIPGLRWWMMVLIMLGSILNYLTRSTLAVAAPAVLKDLRIDEHQYSYILVAFQIAIMFQPICGYVMDILGLRIGLAIFATGWSLANIAHALANSWPVLAILRAFMGFNEGSAGPAGMKATAEWFPAKERGVAGGIYNVGASFGSMLAPPLVVWAMLSYNWQAAFIMTGGLGLVWVALWFLLYRSPGEHPALAETEREHITSGQETFLQGDGKRPSIWVLAKRRNFWGIAIPRFLADPTWGTLQFWLPLYLINVRHFDLKQIALFSGCRFWLPTSVVFAGRRLRRRCKNISTSA